jgi:hypothetical protein
LSHGTWGYVKDGSFQFGSAAYYRSTPNMNIRDEREGAGTFHLTSGPQQLNMTLTSGFDAAIFCGTGGIGDRALMHKKFGERLIRIRPVRSWTPPKTSPGLGAGIMIPWWWSGMGASDAGASRVLRHR